MEDLLLFSIYMVVLNGVLLICGLIADYILPHIAPLVRYIDSLPDWDDDDEEALEDET